MCRPSFEAAFGDEGAQLVGTCVLVWRSTTSFQAGQQATSPGYRPRSRVGGAICSRPCRRMPPRWRGALIEPVAFAARPGRWCRRPAGSGSATCVVKNKNPRSCAVFFEFGAGPARRPSGRPAPSVLDRVRMSGDDAVALEGVPGAGAAQPGLGPHQRSAAFRVRAHLSRSAGK